MHIPFVIGLREGAQVTHMWVGVSSPALTFQHQKLHPVGRTFLPAPTQAWSQSKPTMDK